MSVEPLRAIAIADDIHGALSCLPSVVDEAQYIVDIREYGHAMFIFRDEIHFIIGCPHEEVVEVGSWLQDGDITDEWIHGWSTQLAQLAVVEPIADSIVVRPTRPDRSHDMISIDAVMLFDDVVARGEHKLGMLVITDHT